MKWELTAPDRGDMIRVKSGSIYHFGVYVSDEEVIQFGLAPTARLNIKDSDVTVCSTDIDAFLNGGFLEVAVLDRKESKKRRPPEKTVQMARLRIGEGGYNILYNNCEHFATDCVLGERKCTQTNEVRNLFRNLPLLNVYVAKMPEKYKQRSVFPADRQDYINEASNPNVRKSRYFVWRLLEYALEHTFGQKIKEVNFKNENGKWSCDKCKFSLSHSGDLVAVAISRLPVGIDVEPEVSPRSERFFDRIMTANEKLSAQCPTVEMWCKKEAIFKAGDKELFIPNETETKDFPTNTKKVNVDGTEYVVVTASSCLDRMIFYTNIDLLKY